MTLGQHAPHPGAVMRVLLVDAIDYAGLFPPAQLDMPGAVAEYASYLQSDDSWALGRFVVPASRLRELAVEAAAQVHGAASLGGPRSAWRLSALLAGDVGADVERIQEFNAAQEARQEPWSGRVESVELRGSSPEAIQQALRIVPSAFDRFVEIPITGDPTPLVRAIADAGAYAKVRTGGTTADAFPSSDDLARFLTVCIGERVPFKATAGLHHPLRGAYPLTYAPDSAQGTMYGFLNVFLASAFLSSGATHAAARQMLEERDITAVRFDESGVTWRGLRLTSRELAAARDTAVRSFGSCSFREPLDDLASLGLT